MRFAVFMGVLLALVGFAMAWPDRIGITGHEGDLFHMIDAALRLADGEIPHLDFMTPLGILSFTPMAWFMSLGFIGGKAALLSNLLVALLLAPLIWWVGYSRLAGRTQFVFGAAMIILCSALVYGGSIPTTSLSMFYNRWCWALVFCILVAILWPARVKEPIWVLGLIIGLGLSILALTKMTYFITFVLPIVVILLAQKRWAVLGVVVATGAIVLAVTSYVFGIAFWQAYAKDLLQVALHSERGQPGVDLTSTLSSPPFVAGSVALVGAVIWLRKTGREALGLYLLLLAPAFVLVTWQNWGNDPKWLFLVGLLVVSNLPQAGKAREVGLVIASIAFTVLAPSMVSLTTSLGKTLSTDWTTFTQITPSGPISDIWIPTVRAEDSYILTPIEGLPREEPLRVFNGVTLPDCRLREGLIRIVQSYLDGLATLPETQGQGVLLADLVNMIPLMSDFPRLEAGAPWYYGSDPGFADAEYVLIPKCPLRPYSRTKALDALEEGNIPLELVLETPQMFLFAVR